MADHSHSHKPHDAPAKRRRGLTAVLGAAVIAGLLLQTALPATVLAGTTPGNTDHLAAVVSGTPTAGTALSLTITAQDSSNRTVRNYVGVHCLTFSDTAPASPSGANPTYPPTSADCPTSSTVTFTNGVANMTVALNQAVTDFYAGAHALTVSDPSLPVTSPAVAYVVGPGPATNLSFTAQPIDTQKGSPIYSACLPDPSLSCATSSPTVTVLAKDTWLNLASTTVTIGISPSGTGLGSKATVNGVADFGQQLSINTTGFYRLRASADGTTADSNSIQIVDQLKACTGNACKNVVNNGQKNVQLAVNTIAPITGQTFTGTSVLLATSFFDTAQYAGKCGAAPFIGQGTQAIVEGAGTSTVQPTTTMLLIMPKRSLQAFGVASRNAASFNICLGATRLDGQTGSWQSKNADGTLGLATPDPSPATATSTYWGNVADCGTPNLTSSDPCAAVKSKNVADVVAYFNGIGDTATANSIPSLMQNSDLAIVIHKAFPFDGKGMYQ